MKPGHELRPFIRLAWRCAACRFTATLGKIDANVDGNGPGAPIDQIADIGDGLMLHFNQGEHAAQMELKVVPIP